MTTLPIDTLKMAIGLEKGGFTRQQAQAFVYAIVASRGHVRSASQRDLHPSRHKAAAMNLACVEGLHRFGQRLTIRLGGMLLVWTIVLLAAIRYLPGN